MAPLSPRKERLPEGDLYFLRSYWTPKVAVPPKVTAYQKELRGPWETLCSRAQCGWNSWLLDFWDNFKSYYLWFHFELNLIFLEATDDLVWDVFVWQQSQRISQHRCIMRCNSFLRQYQHMGPGLSFCLLVQSALCIWVVGNAAHKWNICLKWLFFSHPKLTAIRN